MAFNVKSHYALAVCRSVLSKPVGERNGITGFWKASLARVQDELVVRVAYLPDRRFVFEADIDADATHIMVSSRIDEYIEHECLKRSLSHSVLPLDAIRKEMREAVEHGRIVVAFRNARAFQGDIDHTARNPVWYTKE